jgi:predicted nucleic acid-binding protein
VLDASALVRAIVRPEEPAAVDWARSVQEGTVHALVPDLAYAEAANALAQYVRHGEMDALEADDAIDFLLDLPFEVHSLRLLARPALALSLTRGVSVYDACYLALAIGYDAVLVTADRRLAEQAERVALLPEAGPPPG